MLGSSRFHHVSPPPWRSPIAPNGPFWVFLCLPQPPRGAGLVHWRETTEKEDEDGVVLPFEEGYGFMVRNYLLRKAHELVYVVPMYKTAGKGFLPSCSLFSVVTCCWLGSWTGLHLVHAVFEGKWWSNSFIWEDLAEDKVG